MGFGALLSACTGADISSSLMVSPSEVNKFLELPRIHIGNQNSVSIQGTCRDGATKVNLNFEDSSSTPQSVHQEVDCQDKQFQIAVDLSSLADGKIIAKVTTEKGFQSEVETYKDTIRPSFSLTASTTVNVHKDTLIEHTIVSSESNSVLDPGKFRLTGAMSDCLLEVNKNFLSTTTWTIQIGGCSSEGEIQIQIDEGAIKDESGNPSSAQVNLAPVNVYNHRLALVWVGGAGQHVRSATTAQFSFKVTDFDPSSGTPTWPGIASYLEKSGDLSGCTFSESGTLPDLILTVAGCTAANSQIKFRLAKDNFQNPAGLKNLESAWSEILVVDNVAPTLTLMSPAVMSGGAGTTFTWTASFSGADAIALNNSLVSLSGSTTNCAVSVGGAGSSNRTISVSGCSAASGSVSLNILAGAATDLAGNAAALAGGGSLSITNVGPTLSIGTPSFSAVNALRTLEFPLTYTNATNVTLSLSDITLTMSGTVSGCTKNLLGTGVTSRTVQLQNCQGDGSVQITIASGTAVDVSSVLASSAGPSSAVVVDNTAPTFILTSTGGSQKTAAFNASIQFSESLVGISNAFTLNDGSISAFSNTDSAVNFTITPTFTIDPLTLNLPASSFSDAAGNALPALSQDFSISLNPQITLATSDGRSNYSGMFQVDIIASQDVVSPTTSSFTATGANKGLIIGALRQFTIYLTPMGSSTITLQMNASGTSALSGGLPSLASNLLVVNYTQPLTIDFEKAEFEFLEGHSPSNQNIRVIVSPTPAQSVSLNLVVDASQSTATSGDHNLVSQSLTIPPGGSYIDIPFTVFGNTLQGSGDPLSVIKLTSSLSYVKFGRSTAKVVIIDDEKSNPTFSWISAGFSHTCGIKTSGQLMCWGQNINGQLGDGTVTNRSSPTLIDSGVGYTNVAAGAYHTCGITTGGQLKCWGQNNNGQLGDGTTMTRSSPTLIDSGVTYTSIAAGIYHTCGITIGGQVKCWGYNNNGQLGDGTVTTRSNPTLIDSGVTYNIVGVGAYHTCGVTTSGQLKCWGFNNNGQLGDGTVTIRSSPTLIDSGVTYTSIAAGGYHTCGVVNGGGLRCWGANGYGQLGDGTIFNRLNPTSIDSITNYSKISSGGYNTCAITSSTGELKCWGSNSNGQIGDGSIPETSNPTVIDSSVNYSVISSGGNHTCGITSSTGEIKCWGYNNYGQLGDGTGINKFNSTTIDLGLNYANVSSGIYHTCGITTGGQLKCWGNNNYGQLGDGTNTIQSSPIVIESGVTYSSVAVGMYHTCGITTGGQLKCWGYNNNGQLGDGTTVSKNSPTVIDPGTGYLSVSGGQNHTCGITNSGVLKCWGYNNSGQLGDGTLVSKNSPTVIDPGTSYLSISSGGTHTCGITISGVLKCWGVNSNGQLGDGTVVYKNSPTLIDSGTPYVRISSAIAHTCGVTNSGVLKCWGLNSEGQLGDGTNVFKSVPTNIGTNYSKVSSGSYHTCAVDTGGVLKCWGLNYYGQLGIYSVPQYLLPRIVR